jgi:hypothetical protein
MLASSNEGSKRSDSRVDRRLRTASHTERRPGPLTCGLMRLRPVELTRKSS